MKKGRKKENKNPRHKKGGVIFRSERLSRGIASVAWGGKLPPITSKWTGGPLPGEILKEKACPGGVQNPVQETDPLTRKIGSPKGSSPRREKTD